MPITHALVPVAVAVAFAKRSVTWRLLLAAMIAAALPDLDVLVDRLSRLPENSVYLHRGAAHSLFVALGAGMVARSVHKRLNVSALAAGAAVAAAMASHGLLDMMTDSDRPVAYLWPLSSVRLFADCRLIHGGPIRTDHLLSDAIVRLRSEAWQLIAPMFTVALAFRLSRALMPDLLGRRC